MSRSLTLPCRGAYRDSVEVTFFSKERVWDFKTQEDEAECVTEHTYEDIKVLRDFLDETIKEYENAQQRS